jgi:hypothetical protein
MKEAKNRGGPHFRDDLLFEPFYQERVSYQGHPNVCAVLGQIPEHVDQNSDQPQGTG